MFNPKPCEELVPRTHLPTLLAEELTDWCQHHNGRKMGNPETCKELVPLTHLPAGTAPHYDLGVDCGSEPTILAEEIADWCDRRLGIPE